MSSIVPLSEIAPELACKYLQSQGMSREVINWKYFDADFNAGRNRGWVWLRDDEVRGFVGQIPFHIARGNQKIEAHWICDWSIDAPQSNAGAGARLFKRAIAACSHPMVVGGNAVSIPLLDRMAARTDFHATAEYRRFLRLEPILQAAQNRLPPIKILRDLGLGNLPIARGSKARDVSIRDGISTNIAPLLTQTSATHWSAHYDLPFLQWQIERCPQLRCVTIYDREIDPQIALVAWTHEGHSNWRCVLCITLQHDFEWVRHVMLCALSHLMNLGATQVSCVVSRWDDDVIATLEGAGLKPTKLQRPLFFYDNVLSDLRLNELQNVNFLAADLGHRF